MKWLSRSFPIFYTLSLLVTSCGGSGPSAQPPVAIQPNSVFANNGDYLNIQVNSVEFKGSTGDSDEIGELQLITVVSDDSGHSDALICPYGAVIKIQAGDTINPCNAGISYSQDIIEDHLYIMMVAVDIDDTGVLADISTGALSTGLAFGLKEAISTAGFATTGSAPVVIGFLALDAVIGFAGGKAQEYFEKNDVIGSQSFILSRISNWNNNQPINALSTNGAVDFSFFISASSSAQGTLVEEAPAEPALVEPTIPNSPATETSNIISTGSESQHYSDPADFARWYFTSLSESRDFKTLWDNYLTSSFQSHSSDGVYKNYTDWWGSVTKIDIHSVDVIKNDGTSAWIHVNVTFHLKDGRVLENREYDYDLTFDQNKNTWMFDYHY